MILKQFRRDDQTKSAQSVFTYNVLMATATRRQKNIKSMWPNITSLYVEANIAYLHIQQTQRNISIHLSCFWPCDKVKHSLSF